MKEQVGIVSHYLGFGKEQEPDVSTATNLGFGMVKDVSLEFDDLTKDVLEEALKVKDDPEKEIVQALQWYKLGRDIVIRASRRLATLDQHGKSEIELHDIRADFEKSLFEWTVSDVESIDKKLGALGFSEQTKAILASKTMDSFFGQRRTTSWKGSSCRDATRPKERPVARRVVVKLQTSMRRPLVQRSQSQHLMICSLL